jgi:hypothetical protein
MMQPELATLTSELPANGLVTLFVVPTLQWLKRSQAVTWVNQRTAFPISVGIAALGAVGIHFSYDSSAGALTITGLTVSGLIGGIMEWAKQIAAQHWGHRVYRALETAAGRSS